MPIITELKPSKRKNERYSIYIDGVFYCSLQLETILKEKIVKGMEISKNDIENIQFRNEKLLAFDKALSYVARGIKTQKQIKDYLYKKLYLTETVDYVINKLKEYKYINDQLFSNEYVKYKSNSKGKKLIKYELKNKGVSDIIINSSLEQVENETDTINKLIDKYMKNKTYDEKNKIKLIRNLLSKGFDYNDVGPLVKKKFKEIFDESWD